MSTDSTLVGISPDQFIHVLNKNSNITRLVLGPRTFHLQTHEQIVLGPSPMICVPPGFYCKILNPLREYEEGVKCDLALGQAAIKLQGERFALYPGEQLAKCLSFGQKGSNDYSPALERLPIIPANCALRVRALQDLKDEDDELIPAGEIWHVEGPRTYIPSADEEVEDFVYPTIIRRGEVLRLRAIQSTSDHNGKERVTGEEWLVSRCGAYLRGVWEEVVGLELTETLTVDQGLHLRATQTKTDVTGQQRHPGDEWLLTGEEVQEYFPQVGVEVVKKVNKLVVKKGEYAVVVDPVGEDGHNQLGIKVLKVGLCHFFLHPGESLEGGHVHPASILSEDESIVLQAVENFTDMSVLSDKGKGLQRKAGDRWMICGPLSYIPPVAVKIIKRRTTIPLSKNEGVYVQDIQTGQVRAVMGPCSYMLTAVEELWKKVLPEETEELLRSGGGSGSGDIRKMAYFEQSIDPDVLKGRDQTRVITFRCPGNTAVQVNNFKQKTSRIVFGPDLVVLGPDETFGVLHLSAGKPKVEKAMTSLCLMLGPDFITDVIEVETSDHARLRIQVAFNNHFEVDKKDPESAQTIFKVPDFIGFACRQLGSRIRAIVALTPFDEFHRNSAYIIQRSVFEVDENGKLQTSLTFSANNLVVTSIDIQSIEPVDTKMRDSLMKSVQMAIEISTRSVEAAAEHEANRREQIARGLLERQRLKNDVEAEKERSKLYALRAATAAVESCGQAKAEAQAVAERTLIECHSEIETTRLRTRAQEIEHNSQLEAKTLLRASELNYKRKLTQLELLKEKRMASLEAGKFSDMVSTIGPGTILKIARAGPLMKVRMLKALGMETNLFTDGSSPLNLFNTAEGLIGRMGNS